MNSIYEEKYEIRQAKYEEVPEIMEFIDKHWKKGHIFAINRDFFEYEFVVKNKVNFFLAKNKITGEIEGLQGFLLPCENIENRDIWGSIWKVRNDHPNIPFLGLQLKEILLKITKASSLIGVGINPKTALIIDKYLLKAYCTKMNHYYRLNNIKEYKIAKIKEKIFIDKDTNTEQIRPKEVFSIDELSKIFDFSLQKKQIPIKDKWYINRRFFNHPIYKYRIFAMPDVFFITRSQEYNGSKVLRLVDFAGNQETFSKLYDFFGELINGFEYIDFYNLGFKDEYLKKSGFIKREENSKNIIPNYFAPFVQENIDIYVTGPKDALYFKADADQDRPN